MSNHTFTWNEKTYSVPFDLNFKIDEGKEIEIKNRFTGEPCKLPWFAAAVYDLIIGAEAMSDFKTVREGLDWFRKYFPKQYMVILDWC